MIRVPVHMILSPLTQHGVHSLSDLWQSQLGEVSKLMNLALWQLKLLHGPTLLKEGMLKDRSKVLKAEDHIES